MDTTQPGLIAQILMCPRCYRILAESSGDDCPSHTLPCCGGKGVSHAPGCRSDPVFIAGQKFRRSLESALARVMAPPAP